MKRATGLGGIFFKAEDPERLYSWYERHLGLAREHGLVMFRSRDETDPDAEAATIWSIFPKSTKYFQPSESSFMINYRVDDLDALLDTLRAEGVTVDEKRDDSEYGKFGWIMDPEGNRIELWQPPKKEK